MSIIDVAVHFANRKHAGQLDDDKHEYIYHPIRVSNILKQVTFDENILTAAILHDTLEDTDTSYDELMGEFGERIADLVNEVTHEGTNDNHGYYFPRLHSREAIMIKFADRLDNLSRMSSWSEQRQEQYMSRSKFWRSE